MRPRRRGHDANIARAEGRGSLHSYLCISLVYAPLPLPRYCHAAAGWLFGLTLHHLPTRPRTVQGVCSPSHLSCVTCPAQPSCSGRLGTPKASCLQTKPQPIASSPADLSAEGKAKLSLDVLLFILLGFPDRQAGAQGVQ